MESPTQLAGKIFAAGRDLLACDRRHPLPAARRRSQRATDAEDADLADLIDRSAERRAAAERAMDRVRGKFGHEAVVKGLALDDDSEGRSD